ncbi:MAG: helix-turn-helix transcriptional regulator [Eubacteriales bacterium]|nr:helix-turn-helix transcriptional regulator [Eubacteriales bacterium]
MTLEQLRKQNGLTQCELAELLGVSQACVGNYESGIRRPRPEVAQRISDLFNLDGKELWSMFYSGKESEVPAHDTSPAHP